jgi:uncharacterized membrane-anchored protein
MAHFALSGRWLQVAASSARRHLSTLTLPASSCASEEAPSSDESDENIGQFGWRALVRCAIGTMLLPIQDNAAVCLSAGAKLGPRSAQRLMHRLMQGPRRSAGEDVECSVVRDPAALVQRGG